MSEVTSLYSGITAEMSIEQAHELRKRIDANIVIIGQFKNSTPMCAREASLAYTKLQEAKMWMGKCIEVLGEPLPEKYQDKAV